jgi:hypothetical protein
VAEKRVKRGAGKAKPCIEDAFGPPPVVGAPPQNDEPQRDPNAPSGSLSADEAEAIVVDFTNPANPGPR